MSRRDSGSAARKIVAVLLGLVLWSPSFLSAAVDQFTASSISSGWVTSRYNWQWALNADSSYFVWTFNSPLATAGSNCYLNVKAAVMGGDVNRYGGSGYSKELTFWISLPRKPFVRVVVSPINPYAPRDPADSTGIGYQVYGGTPLPAALCTELRSKLFRVYYFYEPGPPAGFRQESLALTYLR